MASPAASKVKPGSNPEELIGAAHAACFTMALSAEYWARPSSRLSRWRPRPTSRSKKSGDGFAITCRAPFPERKGPRRGQREISGARRHGQSRMSGIEALQYQDHAGCEADVVVVIPGRVEDANYDVQLHIGESRDFPDAHCASEVWSRACHRAALRATPWDHPRKRRWMGCAKSSHICVAVRADGGDAQHLVVPGAGAARRQR